MIPKDARADISCPSGASISIAYEADTLPEDDPVAPWNLDSLIGEVTRRVEGGVLVIGASAFDAGVIYSRSEESLARAGWFSLEARVWFDNLIAPPHHGPAVLSFADGEKEAGLHFVDYGWTRVLRLEPVAGGSPEIEFDWTAPHAYRLSVERHGRVRALVDGAEVFDVAYDDLGPGGGSGGFGLAMFGSEESTGYWDFVRYGICQAPEERPPLTRQVDALKTEVEALDMPPVFRVFFSRRLDQALADPERLSQAQAFYRIGREVFVLKRVGLLRDDAAAFETLLDFARTTAAPEVGREEGYFGRVRVTSVVPKVDRVVPGKEAGLVRVFVDLEPAGMQVVNPMGLQFALSARLGIVREATGEVMWTSSAYQPLPERLPAFETFRGPPLEFVWDGMKLDGTPVLPGEGYFFDATIEYLVILPGGVIGYIDSGMTWLPFGGGSDPAGEVRVAGRHFAGTAHRITRQVFQPQAAGRYFIQTSELSAGADPVLEVKDIFGNPLAANDDCEGREDWIVVYRNGIPVGKLYPPVSCYDENGGRIFPCPADPRGTRNACLSRSFGANSASWLVVRASGNDRQGLGRLSIWRKEEVGARAIRWHRVSAPEAISIGGTRVRFAGGWSAGDELDLIVPSPERAWRIEAGSRPLRAPGSLYLLDSSGNTSGRFDIGGGMAGGARISDLAARTQGLVLVGGDEPWGASTRRAVVDVYVNDVGHEDRDGDGLGRMLEESLGTDPDNRDTDGDGLWDGFEVLGIRGAGLYPDQALPTWGADPRHKDVFLESDYYNAPSLDHPGRPLSPAGALLMAEYAGKCSGGPGYLDNPDGRRGFSIHVDSGVAPLDYYGNITTTAYGDWGGTSGVPVDDCFQFEYGWRYHMSPIRHGIFRYGVGCPGMGGSGSIGRPYFYFGSDRHDPDHGKLAIHELGHNFGLEHFGKREDGSSFNFKPHYISLMNYAYEWGSPNPNAQIENRRPWDPDNLRFSEGERRYELDAQGNRTGREYALDPAALDEGILWPDVPSWGSTTGYDLSHGISGWQSYPWYRLEYVSDSGRYPWLAIDWDRDGDVHPSPGAWTKADVLVWESATFKRWDFKTPVRFGPYLADGGSKVYVFFVKENRNRISYRTYSEPEDCDPEDIGPVGQEGLPGSGEPPCGAWSGEREIGVDLSIDGDLSIVRDPNSGSQLLFYRDTQDRLCLLQFSEPDWWGPVCAPSDIRSAPEAIVYGDRIIVFGLGETDPYSKVGPVLAVEIPAASPHDTYSWVSWPVLMMLDQFGNWLPLASRTTPALAVDPRDVSLLGATIAANHAIHMFTNPWGGWISFQELPGIGYWQDRPRVTEELEVFLEERKTDDRPALFIERLPNGLPRWTMWIHGDVEDDAPPERAFNGYYRFVSTIVSDPAGPRPAFSMIFDGSTDGVNPVNATKAMNVSLVKYHGKLRAAIGYDVGEGSSPGKGFIFFPLADGVFHAALKDVNDVELIGQRMADTLGPLFHGMSDTELDQVLQANHLSSSRALLCSGARYADTAFDGTKDDALVDLRCYPDLTLLDRTDNPWRTRP